MPNVVLKQGEDRVVSVEILENNQTVDVSVCPIIRGIIEVNGIEQKRYSLAVLQGYGLLEVDAMQNNKINFILERDDTKDWPLGRITAAVLCQFPDGTFPDGDQSREYGSFSIGSVVTGELKDEPIP